MLGFSECTASEWLSGLILPVREETSLVIISGSDSSLFATGTEAGQPTRTQDT